MSTSPGRCGSCSFASSHLKSDSLQDERQGRALLQEFTALVLPLCKLARGEQIEALAAADLRQERMRERGVHMQRRLSEDIVSKS